MGDVRVITLDSDGEEEGETLETNGAKLGQVGFRPRPASPSPATCHGTGEVIVNEESNSEGADGPIESPPMATDNDVKQSGSTSFLGSSSMAAKRERSSKPGTHDMLSTVFEDSCSDSSSDDELEDMDGQEAGPSHRRNSNGSELESEFDSNTISADETGGDEDDDHGSITTQSLVTHRLVSSGDEDEDDKATFGDLDVNHLDPALYVDLGDSFKIKANLYCPYCNKVFADKAWWRIHEDCYFIRVQTELFNAGKDPKMFVDADGNWSKFECEVCGHFSNGYVKLRTHMMFHFPPSVVCKICGDRSFDIKRAETHVLTHGPKFECLDCKRMYNSKATLETHMEDHSTIKDVTCTEAGCDHTFASDHNLKIHLGRVHGILSQRRRKKRTKRFKCPVCDHWSFSSYQRRRHLVVAHPQFMPTHEQLLQGFTFKKQPVSKRADVVDGKVTWS